jgi:hypothetical protein
MHEMQGYGVAVVFDLLGKAIRQAGETAHPHPHCEILALYETGRNVLRVRLSAEYASPAPDFLWELKWTGAGCEPVRNHPDYIQLFGAS